MVIRVNGNFERIAREFWDKFERILKKFKREFEFQRKTGTMKMWRKWSSRKKLEKWNCDEKEVGRILKKKKKCL
jgi:hypothetical protein